MSDEKKYDSSQRDLSRHRNYRDRGERGRSRSRRRSRDNQESINEHRSNNSTLHEYSDYQQRRNVQHWTSRYVRQHIFNPLPLYASRANLSGYPSRMFPPFQNHPGVFPRQPVPLFSVNTSRDLSRRFSSPNHQGSSYLMHERNSSLSPLQGNTSNTRNHENLLHVRLHKSYSNSKTQENSHFIRPQEDLLRRQQQQPQQLQSIAGVSMTRLPFVEVIESLLEVLLHPTDSHQSREFKFAIPEQILTHFKQRTNNSYQVLVRFCKYNQDNNRRDDYPSTLKLIVNGALCPLPGCSSVPRGPAAPIAITSKCDFLRNNNIINVRSCEQLVMFVQVTRKLTHEDLLQKLLAKSSIPPTVTVAKIKEKLQEDKACEGDITMTSLHFALLCPLSKTRMEFPCRALTCEHLQCFDAAFYLKMNEKKPKWICPVCADPIEYENLQIDEHFKRILEENISSDKILLQADGNWKPFLSEELSENILTLDDTLDTSSWSTNTADNTDNICEAHQTTIDLVSEDEASIFDEDAYSEFRATDEVPITDSQNNREVEVVVLSEDDSFGSPAQQALQQQQQSHSPQKYFEQHSTSTPNTNLPLNTSKKDKSETATPTSAGKITAKGVSPQRMVLRSHSRMKKN